MQLIDACMDGSGLTVFIGTRAPGSRLAALQRRDVDLYRRQAHRRGRHHRPDAHALLARHQRRRQPVAHHQPRLRQFLSHHGRRNERHQPTDRRRPAAESARIGRSPPSCRQQRDDYYDRLLRKTAEFDNYRKRTERERIQLSEAAAADLLEELLPARRRPGARAQGRRRHRGDRGRSGAASS